MKFIHILFVLMACLTFTSCKEEQKEYLDLVVGTYTGDLGWIKGKGKGIYQMRINLTDGIIDSSFLLKGNLENPAYVRKAGDFYLAVSEINGDERSPFGRVNILNKDMSGGRSFVTNGTSPCHIGIAKEEDIFGVANYNGGTAVFFSLKPELDEIFPKVFQFQCEKSDHPRQDASHMHSVMFNPDGVHIAAADLGCDTIRIFKWQNKELTYHPELSFRTEKHCGPRHTDWSNDGIYLAVSCELSSQISIYEFSPSGSKLVSILSTLPEGYTEDNTVSDIHFHPNNQFVYTANRGHNSIAAYKMANDGKLTLIGQYETKGKIPRNFMITKNGKHLLAANQSSDNITIFTISEDGTLKYLSQVPQATPVCLEEI